MHQPSSAEVCVAEGLHRISRSWYEAPDYPDNSIDHSYKQIVGQPLKNFRTFWATRKCSQESDTHPYLDPDESTHTLTPCLCNVHFNIIFPPLSKKVSSRRVHLPRCKPWRSLPYLLRACPSHCPWLRYANKVSWGVKIMELFTTQFFQPPVTSCYAQTLFSVPYTQTS